MHSIFYRSVSRALDQEVVVHFPGPVHTNTMPDPDLEIRGVGGRGPVIQTLR